MKDSVYIETSVISFLNGRPTRDLIISALQAITREWWDIRKDDFDCFVSESVIREAERGAPLDAACRIESMRGIPVLRITEEAVTLAKNIVDHAYLPQNATEDALHIAIAAVNEMDYLLTWNCKHIANAVIVPKMENVCTDFGYTCPRIWTPQELMEKE